MMTCLNKGGGNHRGCKGLIKDGSKQTSELISTGPKKTRPLIASSEPRPPTRWIHDRCSVCCFLTRWSAESRCRHCTQSGRGRRLTLRPATDLLSPLRRIYFQRNRWSSVPATCVKSHWAENETPFSPCIRVWQLLLRVGEHSTMLCTCSCFLTKDQRCMRRCVG